MINRGFSSLQELGADPLLNQVLKESYRIEEKIGEGGMGVVYRATQLLLGRSVAVKILSSFEILPKVKERFFREAKALSKLKHPNVVSIFDFGVTDTRVCYMVMEYVTGRTLGEIVSKDSGLPIDVIVEIMEQICSGVGAAHKENIVHRDLKPSNIFLADISGGAFSVKILDFGIAKTLEDFSGENDSLTKDGIVLGTAGYVSPEQISETPNIDARADIYALGAILYYLFTGTTPYKGKVSEVITRQITEAINTSKIERFKSFEGQVIKPIICKAMSIDREDRYQSTEEFFDALYQDCADAELLRNSKSGRLFSTSNFLSEVFDQTNEIRKPIRAFKTGSLIGEKESNYRTNATNTTNRINTTNAISTTNTVKKDDSISFSVKKNSFKTVIVAIATFLLIGLTGLLYLNKEIFFGATEEKKLAPNLPKQALPKIVQQGVTDTEILMGMSAAFSGASKELGRQMKLGIDTYFNEVNTNGGVNGRKLTLVSLDDGYEPVKALESMKNLLENRKVFGIIGNVGTPTAEVALPYALEKKALFFGAFTGANLLRKDPPDQYVFNYRASYAEETSYIVEYLIQVKKLHPSQIAVFAQTDSYGDAGFSGVVKAMSKYKQDKNNILRVGYTRNTTDIEEAVNIISTSKNKIKAVVMVCTYKAGAKFIQQLKDKNLDLIFTNVSFVGSNALAEVLMEFGPKYANGVIVTQVVPHYESNSAAVTNYREQLKKFFPNEEPGFVSLEGYLAAKILVQGLQNTGKELTTERLITTLESIHNFDMGIGSIINFSPSEHQGSHKVWATFLDEKGKYQLLE